MAGFPVTFEFDPEKSGANKAKHGIDFVGAQALWAGRTVMFRVKHPVGDPCAVLGMIGGKHWTAFITYREESVRLISVRRSRNDEKALYENQD